jgi:hypothetical protein
MYVTGAQFLFMIRRLRSLYEKIQGETSSKETPWKVPGADGE